MYHSHIDFYSHICIMSKIISITSQKGGVGKSTLTLLFAGALSETGKQVLVIDCDEQASIKELQKLEGNYSEGNPLFQVEHIEPIEVRDYLVAQASKYDYVFIDLPRFTDNENAFSPMQLLVFCDLVIIPVLGGTIEVLSMKKFISSIKAIAEFKEENGMEFNYYAIMNKFSRLKENATTKEILSQDIVFFENNLSNLKLFRNPSTYTSILSTKKGRARFEPFFEEFLTKVNK